MFHVLIGARKESLNPQPNGRSQEPILPPNIKQHILSFRSLRKKMTNTLTNCKSKRRLLGMLTGLSLQTSSNNATEPLPNIYEGEKKRNKKQETTESRGWLFYLWWKPNGNRSMVISIWCPKSQDPKMSHSEYQAKLSYNTPCSSQPTTLWPTSHEGYVIKNIQKTFLKGHYRISLLTITQHSMQGGPTKFKQANTQISLSVIKY